MFPLTFLFSSQRHVNLSLSLWYYTVQHLPWPRNWCEVVDVFFRIKLSFHFQTPFQKKIFFSKPLFAFLLQTSFSPFVIWILKLKKGIFLFWNRYQMRNCEIHFVQIKEISPRKWIEMLEIDFVHSKIFAKCLSILLIS